MTKYSKYNFVYLMQKWIDSVPGQTFLNYAYSWGASIVILGTLFKLTHITGANLMLFIGMGTEVVVFFLSAFDRPFDKTADGKELPTHVENDAAEDEIDGEERNIGEEGIQGNGGGTIILGGIGSGTPAEGGAPVQGGVAIEGGIPAEGGMAGGVVVAGGVDASWIQQQQEAMPDMEEATGNYVEELNKLTEMLQKVAEQSERLTRDSEEMENLNRTLTGICKVYELQLKAASSQVGTIDEINEQTRHMAEQIAELNRIYARMIEAMTTNMNTKIKND